MLTFTKSFSKRVKDKKSSDSLSSGTDAAALSRANMIPPSPSQSSARIAVDTTNGIATEQQPLDLDSETTATGSPQRSRRHDGSRSAVSKLSSFLHRTRGSEDLDRQAIRRLSTLSTLSTPTETFLSETDIATYLQFISEERLTRMPRRGSDWDRVLHAAQFFGLQIWYFGQKVDAFGHGGKDSASKALAACQVLLELGHEQARALLPTFTALQEFSVLLSDIGRIRDLEKLPPAIQEDANRTFGDLVRLVSNIAAQYRQRVSDLKFGSTVHISFDACFGAHIARIWRSKEALSDRIWAYKLEDKNFSISLQQLRWKLRSPVGQTINNRLYDEVDEHLDRSEESCHWFRDILSQFFNSTDQVLCVTGEPSAGKTVLAEWVEERLARPLDRMSYAVLRYDFPHDSPDEATPIAFLKSILFKLLEQNVGNVQLYGHIVRAFEGRDWDMDIETIESSLWSALRNCLQDLHPRDASLVIMLDNCDGIVGAPQNTDRFHDALQTCISQLSHIRVITFCRQTPTLSEGYKHFTITEKEVQEDIQAHFYDVLSQSPHFNDMGPEGGTLIEALVEKSKGNWLWAFYVGRLLYRERSKSSIVNVSRDVKSEISDVLQRVVETLELKTNNTLRTLLSILLVVGRPLSVTELAQFLSVDLRNGVVSSAPFNVTRLISQTCDDIIIIRNGYVHFRSETVRSFMRAQLGNMSLLSAQDANRQLTLRMLLYAKLTLVEDGEPSVDALDYAVISSLFSKNSLLAYVVQNWVEHFRASGFIGTKDELNLNKEFCDVFPDSVMFALLERTCWTKQHTGQYLVLCHELALRIRKACFGKQHVVVLHNLITLGHVHSKVLDSNTAGAKYFYEAVKVGRAVLSETSTIVENCMQLFLACTETLVMTKRTEIVAYREEMIQFIIQVYKRKHGSSSDEVIFWYEKLAQLYLDIKEEHHATVVLRELYEITAARYGKKSNKAKQIGTYFGTLNIVLKGQSVQEIGELEELIFETNEELEVTSDLSIKMWIRLAQSYVACGSLFLAERLYASLWQRITIVCSEEANVDVHIAKIQIALEYVKFLRELGRTEEASNILICLWAEYEHHPFESEKLNIWIREIGLACRTFGLLGIAVTVLTRVWDLFKRKGRSNDEEAQKTSLLITELVEEISKTSTTKEIMTTTKTSEAVVEDIFEFHLARCRKTNVDRDFFLVCMALIDLYIQQKSWHQAEAVIKKTLEVAWGEILSPEIKIKLCEHSVTESLNVARLLAACYSRQGLFEMAERTHLQIFYACLENLLLEDALLDEAIVVLVSFYEEHHRHKDIIGIHTEVLEKYQTHLGRKHRLTIKTLYLLAAHCKMLGREDAYVYYLEIVTALNQGIKHCHHDAVQAALILCRHYQARGLWSDLQQVCAALWETILNHRGEYVSSAETITFVYETYMNALEFNAKVDFPALYNVAVEYKDVIAVVCGVQSSSMVHALIALAGICERNEKHHHESVTIYEDVLDRLNRSEITAANEAVADTIKKRLSQMYVLIAPSIKADSGNPPISVERAIQISLDTYQLFKNEFGCWHQKTLGQLNDVIILYHKTNTKESRLLACDLLRNSAQEIVTKVSINMTLFESATALALIFSSSGMIDEGQELLSQLRHLIIFRGQLPLNSITLELNPHLSKVVFIFLIAFEHGLGGHESGASYSKIMAEIVLETLLYEEYSRIIEKETKLESILESGARLRGFWEAHNRTELLDLLDKRLLPLFKQEYSQCFEGVRDEDVLLLYLCLLAELGKDRPTTRIDFASLACKAANDKVKVLLMAGEFHNANQLSRCMFSFSEKQRLYHHRNRIQYGYKLAEYMAGIDVPHPSSAKESPIRTAMLDTSKAIMTDIIAAFKTIQIDFTSLRPEDLAGLIRLLGAQRNFIELEVLLSRLWQAREVVRKSFGCDPAAIIELGNLLIHAQYAQGRAAVAIDTAKVMYYNLQRGRGRLDPQTLKMSRLLASLYMSTKKPGNAMVVHEAVLREIALASDKSNDGQSNADHQFLAGQAKFHLELLKGAHHQLKGWTRPVQDFHDLHDRLNGTLKLNLPGFEQWAKNSKNSSRGEYIAPQAWTIEKLVKGGNAKQTDSGALLKLVETAKREWVFY